MKYGIFTKNIHVEKIVNYLNSTGIEYMIATTKPEMFLEFDIGVSYCYPYLVNINYPIKDKRVWYNYHPAPLPKYPGTANYVDAINDNVMEYGVTLHLMNEHIDSGNIITARTFPLCSIPIHTNELGAITHYYLFQLFKETIKYLKYKPKTKEDFEALMHYCVPNA